MPVVGNRNNPATRYQDAVSTSRLLGRVGCRYLLTGRVPPEGAVCQVDEVPFAAPPATTAAAAAEASAHAWLLPPTLKTARRG